MEIENLKALIEGIKLNAYQKALAVKEFEYLLASNGYEYQALSMSGVSGSCGSEMFERLINSHFSLFRRLNQINNKEPQPEATQKALIEAREVNRYFADKDSPQIVQS